MTPPHSATKQDDGWCSPNVRKHLAYFWTCLDYVSHARVMKESVISETRHTANRCRCTGVWRARVRVRTGVRTITAIGHVHTRDNTGSGSCLPVGIPDGHIRLLCCMQVEQTSI